MDGATADTRKRKAAAMGCVHSGAGADNVVMVPLSPWLGQGQGMSGEGGGVQEEE